MEFSIKSGNPEKQRTACVVVGVFEGRRLTAPAQAIDRASRGALADVMKRGDHTGKLGTTLLLHRVGHVPADRVLLVGLGRERDYGESAFRTAISAAAKALRSTGAADATLCLTDRPIKGHGTGWKVEQAALAVAGASYRFDRMKSKAPVK